MPDQMLPAETGDVAEHAPPAPETDAPPLPGRKTSDAITTDSHAAIPQTTKSQTTDSQTTNTHTTGAQIATPRRRLARVLPILLVLALAAFLVWWFWLRAPDVPQGVIIVTGRVEGDDAAIAAKTGGRIRDIRVREGDVVKAGDPIATLDDEQVRSREEGAQASLDQATARVTRAQQQIAFLQESLEQAQLSVVQSRAEAE
ncbi:MAG: biotin/lipoyl-binding protein, partial [Pyrinomonadaceae bacterium]